MSCLTVFSFIFFNSVTLYPVHSRIRGRNLVLKHFVSHFPPNSGSGIACCKVELNFAVCLDTRAKKIFIFSLLGIEFKTYHVNSHTLHHYWPLNAVFHLFHQSRQKIFLPTRIEVPTIVQIACLT